MANFYTDNEDIKFHLGHPLMEKIVALKERNYTEAQQYDNAPRDFEDAFDNYDKVLEIVGEICGDVVAVNAESVDAEGPQVVDGHVNMPPVPNKTRCDQSSRLERYFSPEKIQRVEFPDHPVYHGRRDRCPGRCRIAEHLGITGLCRNDQRICQ